MDSSENPSISVAERKSLVSRNAGKYKLNMRTLMRKEKKVDRPQRNNHIFSCSSLEWNS